MQIKPSAMGYCLFFSHSFDYDNLCLVVLVNACYCTVSLPSVIGAALRLVNHHEMIGIVRSALGQSNSATYQQLRVVPALTKGHYLHHS